MSNKLEPGRSKSNKILETNVLQDFNPNARYQNLDSVVMHVPDF